MGIYQLYFLKMHSKLLFLSRNAGNKRPWAFIAGPYGYTGCG